MSNELMTVEVEEHGIFATDEAQSLASNLHTELTGITLVDSPATQLAATEVARRAQGFLKELEASRKSVKQPVLEIGRHIDKLADELAAPVKTEMQRVGAMVAKFQTLEESRVAVEKLTRENAEREAMRAKFAAEDAARIKEAGITNEADLAKAIQAESDAKAASDAAYRTLTAPMPSAVKATGSVTKKVLRYEVTDIHALYKAMPHLVKLEANVAAIKSTCTADMVIPGLKLWEETTTSFRS